MTAGESAAEATDDGKGQGFDDLGLDRARRIADRDRNVALPVGEAVLGGQRFPLGGHRCRALMVAQIGNCRTKRCRVGSRLYPLAYHKRRTDADSQSDYSE